MGRTPMIPDVQQCKELWDTYHLPDPKRIHVALVAAVAVWLARKIMNKKPGTIINIPLLEAAALLHDIDKAIPKLPGERHPEAGVRILTENGMGEVAELVRHHSVHFILYPETAPKTWEEKLLFLADKMVKYEVITVDKRFALWQVEHLPAQQQQILDACYPLVKNLEREIFSLIGIAPESVAKMIQSGYTNGIV